MQQNNWNVFFLSRDDGRELRFLFSFFCLTSLICSNKHMSKMRRDCDAFLHIYRYDGFMRFVLGSIMSSVAICWWIEMKLDLASNH